MIYLSETLYIESGTSLRDKVTKIDALITALEDIALNSAGNMDIEDYSLDDGQSKISTTYRDIDSIIKAISDFEKLRQMYINRINGRIVRLLPANSITNVN